MLFTIISVLYTVDAHDDCFAVKSGFRLFSTQSIDIAGGKKFRNVLTPCFDGHPLM